MHYHPHNPYVNYGKRRTRVFTYLPSGQKVTPPAVVICPRCGGDGIAPDCKHFITKIECGRCGGTGFEKEGGVPIRSYPQLEALAEQMLSMPPKGQIRCPDCVNGRDECRGGDKTCDHCNGTGFREDGEEDQPNQMQSAQAIPVSEIGDIPEGWRMINADEELTYGDFWRLPQGKKWMHYADFLALTKNAKSGGATAYWIRRAS